MTTNSPAGFSILPAALASETVFQNGLSDRITIHCQDIRNIGAEALSGAADMVICNPPFRKCETGRVSPNSERAIARHEISTTPDEILAAAGRMLKPAGEFVVIYPVSRLMDIVFTMRRSGIEPVLLRMIHSRIDDSAKLILLKGHRKSRAGISVLPPLIIYCSDGTYTEEAGKMFQP